MVLGSLDQLDLVTGLQRHHRLLPVRAAALEPAHPLPLALAGGRAHGGHFHVEDFLHRLADLDLVGVEGDLEGDGVQVVLLLHALLGHQRLQQHAARVPAHARASCMERSAARSKRTRPLRSTWYTEACIGVSTDSPGTLRAARSSPCVRSETTTRVGAAGSPRSLRRPVSVFVLASVTPRLSTTTTSPEAILAARASRSAARRISVGIFLSYFRGVGPNGLPPPFHCVARIEPWRARPVPFCFQGFRPPPETSLRPFVSWVPARRAASSLTTLWCRSGTRTVSPNTSADSSSCSCALPFASSTGTVGMLLGLFRFLLLRLGLLHALSHQHDRSRVAGDGAAQQDEVLLGDDPHHGQVEHGAPVAAHPPRQLVAGPDARGIRRGTDGAGSAVKHGTVGRLAAQPAVTLHAALEALALRDPDHVHELAGREELHCERLSRLIGFHGLRLLEAHLAQDLHGLVDAGLLVVSGHRLGDVLLRRLEADLKRIVAVRRLLPHAHDHAGPGLDHGDRDHAPVVAEDLGHAFLPAEQPFLHGHWSAFPFSSNPFASPGGCGSPRARA